MSIDSKTIEEFKRLYVEERLGTSKIAKMYGVSPGTVYYALKKVVKLRSFKESVEKVTPEMLEEFIHLYEQGRSTADIAMKFFVSPATVQNHLKRVGIKLCDREIPGSARKLTPEKAYLLGVLGPGDGHVRYKKGGGYWLDLGTIDEDFALEFKKCLENTYGHRCQTQLYPSRVNYLNGRPFQSSSYYKVRLACKRAVEDVLSYGDLKTFRHGFEAIPEAIKKAEPRIKAAYLRGFFDSQGTVTSWEEIAAGKSAKNHNILNEISGLLSELRIHSRVYLKGRMRVLLIWRRGSIERFARCVGFSISRKRERLQQIFKQITTRHRLTPSRVVNNLVSEMVELWNTGLACDEIANELGLGAATVRRRLKNMGIEILPKRTREINTLIPKMEELRNQDLPLEEIGKRLGVGRETIRKRLMTRGFLPRRRRKSTVSSTEPPYI